MLGFDRKQNSTDLFKVSTVVVVPLRVGKSFLCTLTKYLYFFQILALKECWVLVESRIQLKSVLGCLKIVSHPINSREQTQ